MAHLLLRGVPLGPPSGGISSIDAVLFDKDGTLSHSEAMLQALAAARVDCALVLADLEAHSPERHRELKICWSEPSASALAASILVASPRLRPGTTT
jgi:phosphoglycolate phosphatase-like HAD superfamily hydrolase